MKYIIKAFTFYALLFCGFLHAQPAEKINIAFTLSMPPYLSDDSSSGIEIEIVEAALRESNVAINDVHNVHYKRAMALLTQGAISGIVSNKNNRIYQKLDRSLFASAITLNYVDCAIALKERGFQLNSMADFKGKSIWAFKSASKTLGYDFEKVVKNNPKYSEDNEQADQFKMLVNHRLDIAISDKNIFLSTINDRDSKSVNRFIYKDIAQPTPRVVRFMDENLQQLFNAGLDKIKRNGQYQSIMNRYDELYYSEC